MILKVKNNSARAGLSWKNINTFGEKCAQCERNFSLHPSSSFLIFSHFGMEIKDQ